MLCCCTARRLLTLRINPCCIDAVWDTQHPARSALDFNVPESRLKLSQHGTCSLGSRLKFWAGLFSTRAAAKRMERSVSHCGGITALWLLLTHVARPRLGLHNS